MSDIVHEFDIRIEQRQGFEFEIQLDKPHYAPILVDEPAPLSGDTAPNAARLLAAAVANCLTASLLFCMERRHGSPPKVSAEAHVTVVRNKDRRLRIGQINVVIRPQVDATAEALQKCLETFEDFCVVTQSVREGLDIQVKVEPTGAAGA